MGRTSVAGAAVAVLVAAIVALTVPPATPASHTLAGEPGVPAAVAPPADRVAISDPVTHSVPAAGSGGVGELLVTTDDPAIVPNDGLRVNLTAYSGAQLPDKSSFQVAAEEQIGAYEAVVGIFENSATAPVPFFSVFVLGNDSNVHLAYWTGFPLIAGDPYEFVLQRSAGTVWSVTLNGLQFGSNSSAATFDFGASTATQAGNLSFSETAIFAATTTTPALLRLSLAFGVHRASGWYLPSDGIASFNGTPGTQWGVQGRIQRGTLAPGQLESGTGIANVTDGTRLWTGGAVPLRLGLSLPASSAVATTALPVGVTATDSSGAPVPGAVVYLKDLFNATFLPASVVTNQSGAASSVFETANVTTPQHDVVTGIITLLGYPGQLSVGIDLTPAVQLLLSVSPSRPSVAPSASVELSISVRALNSSPVAGVGIAFFTTVGAILDPPFAVSDSSGSASVRYVAPSVVSTYQLNVSVASPGYWGRLTVPVHVGSPIQTFWGRYGTAITEASVVAGVGAVVAALLLYQRHRRRPLPTMALRRYIRELPKPGAPSAPASEPPPVSRTPP